MVATDFPFSLKHTGKKTYNILFDIVPFQYMLRSEIMGISKGQHLVGHQVLVFVFCHLMIGIRCHCH